MDGHHQVTTQRIQEKVTVIVDGETIAESFYAIKVLEPGHEPTIYIPKNDLKEIDLLKCGDYTDPLKGHAELYTIRHEARDIENAAWSFDEPSTALPELLGKVAFFEDKIQYLHVGENY
jgi:uncharacterized protein (DUF427 family)